MFLLFYFAFATTLFCLVSLFSTPVLLGRSPEVQRVLDVVGTKRPDDKKVFEAKPDSIKDPLLKLAQVLRSKIGFGENAKLNERLATAGLRSKSNSDRFFAVQFLTPLAGAVAGSFFSENTIFWVLALAVCGYMSPDFWLSYRMGKRKKKIQRSMPDAIDLLVICVDAGLGLDQALLRVGDELAISNPEISEEFNQVNLAQRAGQPRLDAWQALANRTKIDEFIQFVGMLVQTDKFGTPVSKALSRFSDELRMKRRQRAEEAASKTKIKIIFPLVLFIFPCIFIVLLAPAILSIASGLKGLGN